MNTDRGKTTVQVRLTIYHSEPLAQLAGQRLRQEEVRCVVRPLGAGPGGWGSAANLPFAIYVRAEDETRARQVLDLPPSEVAERDHPPVRTTPMAVVLLLIVAAAALVLGTLEVIVNRLIR